MRFSYGFSKLAFVGPIIDAANLGLPSAVGYHLGRSQGMAEGEEEIDPPSRAGKLAKGAFLPGYIGYRFGLAAGRKAAKLKKDKGKEKENENHKE